MLEVEARIADEIGRQGKARGGDIVGAMATTSNAVLAAEIERAAFNSSVAGH